MYKRQPSETHLETWGPADSLGVINREAHCHSASQITKQVHNQKKPGGRKQLGLASPVPSMRALV